MRPPQILRIRLPPSFDSFSLLIAATKGGTGKSTLAIHLAIVAQLGGLKTIILDADADDEQYSCVGWDELRKIPGPKVLRVRPERLLEALAWAKRAGYQFIVIDTPGHDIVVSRAVVDHVDFMLTPSQPSPLDLKATKPIRRLWDISATPAAVVLNGVIRETLPRTQRFVARYSAQGQVLPAFVGRRVQYLDSIEKGLGVSEYMPDNSGDREMRRLLRAIFRETVRRRPA